MKVVGLPGFVILVILSSGCGSRVEEGPTTDSAQSDALTSPDSTNEQQLTSVSPALPTQNPEPLAAADLPQPVVLTDEDWPQYRGRNRDGISLARGLQRAWSSEGPPVVWETSVGQGYAAPSVVADRVYLNDYDEAQGEWMVRCLALETGSQLWCYRVPKRIRPNHAITRSAPATDGGYVFSIDPKCELHCLDARDGRLLWKKFLPAEYDSLTPPWYNGQCPLLEADRLVVATGGRSLIVALQKEDGQPIWESPNPEGLPVSHSSVMPVELEGVRQYTYTTLEGLVGVDAATGELLWHFPWKFNTAVSSTPLPLGEGKFFLTAGYHAQTVICQVSREGEAWVTREVQSLPPPTQGWNSEVHTPIVLGDRIYGIGKAKRGLWTCLDFQGNELWTSEKQASFGMGGYTYADGMFFVLEGKTGVLRVLDATADQYQELTHVKLLQGPDVWAPPIVAHGKLLIRDLGKLICLDVSASGEQVAVTVPGSSAD